MSITINNASNTSKDNQPDCDPADTHTDAHVNAYNSTEETLRQATALVNYVFRHLAAGDVRLTADEADSLHLRLEELVLQAAAVGGCIRQQQAR